MKNEPMICSNITVSGDGILHFAGQNTLELAKQYGTPVYLMDEDRIRDRCRTYVNAMASALGEKGHVLYASKAASYKRMYEIMREEGMGIDVVSSGEVCTALKAGFPLGKAFFHSNNKTDADIEYAIDNGIGYFVVDNAEELYAIEAIATERGRHQAVILRLTPGIDPHTYEAVATGKVDSKFGSAIETGQAEEITKIALSLEHVSLKGFHCHVGSQVFDSDVYIATVDIMLDFIALAKEKLGFETEILDLGGGYGVRYTADQPEIDIAANIHQVARALKDTAARLGVKLPHIYMEPGRSIVADAGMTLYTVGTVKRIPGYKNYVSVDGGMTDNPRFVLYGSPYTVLPAGKMFEDRNMVCDVVGRCCESGDIIQPNVAMPESIRRGDIIACLTTGAYHYSMASNYNRIPRPPVIMLKGGESYVAVRRETPEDLVALDV